MGERAQEPGLKKGNRARRVAASQHSRLGYLGFLTTLARVSTPANNSRICDVRGHTAPVSRRQRVGVRYKMSTVRVQVNFGVARVKIVLSQ